MESRTIFIRFRGLTSSVCSAAKSRVRKARGFKHDQNGGVSVEAMLWMPFFLVLIFGIAELALVFHGHARALNVAQETNRGYSVGRFASTADAENWAALAMSQYSDGIVVQTSRSDLIVTTEISIPAGDFSGNIGFLQFVQDFRILAKDQQVVEF
ncbi:MAG: TadE/TadG family type IV pilus assembly protein [Boseongicola sp.]